MGMCLAAVATVRVQTPAAPSVWTGVYTKEQAKTGEDLFWSNCVDCHGEDLAGREQAPALAGMMFQQKWDHATVRKLFDTVTQMPPDAPESLTPKQYADVVAFLLSANEFPAGTVALPEDRGPLGDIELTFTKPTP